MTPAVQSIVVMGVSGCGKSSLGLALAAALGLPFIEGDAHHSADNLAKMRAGMPLTDADRLPWLQDLSVELQRHQRASGVVLACSALRLSYRNLLRSGVPGLRFVWLNLSHAVAQARVGQRGAEHFFDPSLVTSQFAALEPPHSEADVICLDAELSLTEACATALQALAWPPSAAGA